ncbi:MAG: hypothetical protein L0154_15210 [Chloroflexi bacterium]|nr:hypothetical protein [Chloroflexota bacterium]
MTAYDFERLSDELVFIRWNRVASRDDARAYLSDLTTAIEQAPGKIYFFSDLRNGHITDARVLREMGRLTNHPNWGGGVAVVENLSAEIFVQLFGRFVTPDMTDYVFDDVSKALDRLDRWQPGIAAAYHARYDQTGKD